MNPSFRRSLHWPRLAAFVALFLYIFLLGLVTIKHTFWRDETQAWLIARDSPSLLALLHNLRYEGHPPLWHLALYTISRFTWNPDWMKLPNFLCAVGTAALLLLASRLNLFVRLGFVFSYFLLFEYGTLDRNYMLGVFLLVAATLLFANSRDRFSWKIPVLLSLTALSSLPALILAFGLFALFLGQSTILDRQPLSLASLRPRSTSAWLASILFCICTVIAVLMIRPPADTGVFLDSVHLAGSPPARIFRLGKDVAKALIPLFPWEHRFWNDTLVNRIPRPFGPLLGWVLLPGLLLLLRSRAARAFFGIASFILLAQIYFSGRPFLRHVGWFFIAFLISLLIDSLRENTSYPPRTWRFALITILLGSQATAGLLAAVINLHFPFSSSRQVADLLRSRHLETAPLIFEPDFVGASVLSYLQRPRFYDIETHAPASFVLWNRPEFLNRHTPQSSDLAPLNTSSETPVLITEVPLSPDQQARLHLHQLAVYDDSICGFDTYYIYH